MSRRWYPAPGGVAARQFAAPANILIDGRRSPSAGIRLCYPDVPESRRRLAALTAELQIDHLVLCVQDLDAARGGYAGLGFTLTPRARHPFGTANSLVQLEDRSFLELLAVDDPRRITPPAPGAFSFADFNRRFLTLGQGMSMLVFRSGDARADQARFAARGLQTYEPFHFSRQATLPDGDSVTVGFTLAFLTDPEMPGIAFFTCQQHAPEHFWKAQYQQHHNGAVGVREVVMLAPEPARHRDFWSRVTPADQVYVQPGALTVRAGSARISMLTPARYRDRFPGDRPAAEPATPRFAAFSVVVPQLASVIDRLTEYGVAHRHFGNRCQVPADAAHGVAVEFVQGE